MAERNVFLPDLSFQPAIKIIDYIRRLSQSGSVPFSTGVAQRVSPTMKELKPLASTDATQWVDYWVAVGMFQ